MGIRGGGEDTGCTRRNLASDRCVWVDDPSCLSDLVWLGLGQTVIRADRSAAQSSRRARRGRGENDNK